MLLFCCCFQVKSQYYDSGQDPSGIKWRQINTDAFKIIFPDFYEAQAMRLAQHLDSIAKAASFSLPANSKKIPLILHTQSAVSNGLVVWAPKRMEWWTTAPQGMESLPWFEQLGLHEYRHVQQTQSVVEGISGVLAFIFGEHITGAIVGLFVPRWFMEGDATVTETALSNNGRGRSADFQMQLKTQLLEKGAYSYDKAAFGSYKDYVPNIYHLGYHLVAFGRKDYDTAIWKNGLQNVAKKPWQLNPFERNIKKYSGLNMSNFHLSAMHYYDSLWKASIDTVARFTFIAKEITPQQKVYTNYLNPRYINDSTVLVLKNGFEQVGRFVEISAQTNKEKKSMKVGNNLYDNFFDYSDGNIVYAEKMRHFRWDQCIYSNLVERKLQSHKRTQLSHKTRYFSPQYSHNGNKMVAIADNALNQQTLIITEASTGNILQQSTPNFEYSWTYPCFSENDNTVYVVGINHKGRAIYEFNTQDQTFSLIKDFFNTNVSHLQQSGDYLFFIADFSGVSQVYALHLRTNALFTLTQVLFGIQNFDVNASLTKIVYSSYAANGYYLEERPLEFIPIAFNKNEKNFPIAEKLSAEEGIQVSFNFSDIDTTYPVEKYHKWKHLLNFHSWAPVAIDPTQQQIDAGVSIMSQNILSTSFLETGFKWNTEEERGALFFDYTYKGFYPILSTSLNYRGRKTHRNDMDITWNELVWAARVRFPLSFVHNNFLYGFSSSVYYEYKHIFPKENYTSTITDNQIVSLSLSAYNQEQTATKFLYPHWGQTLSTSINKSFNSGTDSWLFSFASRAFFPGILNTHSFNLYAGYQYNQQGDISFTNQIQLARGYTNIISQDLISNKINYAFPIVYPDWALGRVLYLKRIHANVFYDFMWYTNAQKTFTYNYSVGTELNFNINAFRFDTPIDMGVRFSYLASLHDVAFDLLFHFSF